MIGLANFFRGFLLATMSFAAGMRDYFEVDGGEGQFGDHRLWMKGEKAAGAFGHVQCFQAA